MPQLTMSDLPALDWPVFESPEHLPPAMEHAMPESPAVEQETALSDELARLCAYSSDVATWERLVVGMLPIVTVAARRVAALWGERDSLMIEDILQEVFLKICAQERRILREFVSRGPNSFAKLLRMIAASVANDHFRRQSTVKRGGHATTYPIAEDTDETEMRQQGSGSVAEIEQDLLYEQLDSLLGRHPREVSERDRALFWLYYRQGLSAAAIAAIPSIQLGVKGVESALRRLTLILRGHVKSPSGSTWKSLRKNIAPRKKGLSTEIR